MRGTSRSDRVRDADIVIVGGGTAGALVAQRLAERTDARILVLEAGPRYPWWALGTPLASYRMSGPWSWGFESQPQPALDGRRIRFPMGKVLGGSSSVNAMIAAQGPASDYDAWAAAGCSGWNWSDIEPSWQGMTDRARAGAVSIEPASFAAPFTHALVGACEEHGLARVDPLTGERSQTCGRFALFQRHRARYTTAHALARAGVRDRVTVATGIQAHRILFDSDQAVGVECDNGESRITIHASGGVVLCAGVFGSPSILMRSGIGPEERVRAAGIDVRAHLPGVGENLHDHIGVPVVCASSQPSPGRKSRWIPAAIRYAISRTGVMASNGCEGGAFLGAENQSPDLEIAGIFQTLHHAQAFEIAAIVMHPESRGFVTIDPQRPLGAPLIEPRALSAPQDLQRLREGINRIRDIASRPSLCNFGLTGELMPGTCDIDAHIRQYASTHYHPVGTCRMGIDAMSVVGPDLAVSGTRNLWVCDASVIPRLPAGHSAATAMIIGGHGADLIAQRMPVR